MAPEQLLKSTFYNEFLKKVEVCQMACVAVAGPSGILEGLSIYRGPSEDEFDRQHFAAARANSAASADCPLYSQNVVGTGVESF